MVKHRIYQTEADRKLLVEIVGFYIRMNPRKVMIEKGGKCYTAPYFSKFLNRYGILGEFNI